MERLPRKRKIYKKWLILILVSLLVVGVDVRPVFAYAILLRTDPADGAVLSTAPAQMRFWFSDPVLAEQSTITLRDGDDKTWDLKPRGDSSDPTLLLVDLPRLPLNSYYLSWRVTAPKSLHASSGSLVFGVQQPVNPTGSPTAQNSSLLELTFHWIGLLSFAVVTGGLLIYFLLISFIRAESRQQQEQLSIVKKTALISAFGGSVISLSAGSFLLWDKSKEILNICSHSGLLLLKLMIWTNSQATPLSMGLAKGLNQPLITGIFFLEWSAVSLICMIALAVLIFHQLRQKNILATRNGLLFGFVILWAIFQTLNSHAVSFNNFSPFRFSAHILHLLGAGIWIGGQIALLIFFTIESRNKSEDRDFSRQIYIQFGIITATGMALLAVTGLYSGGQQIASIDALLFTAYGQVLTIKTLLVLLSNLIGLTYLIYFYPEIANLFHKVISQRMLEFILDKGNLSMVLRVELLGGAVIFLLASFLGSTRPPNGPEFDPPVQIAAAPSQASEEPSSSMVNDLLVDFSIKPNRPGQNFVTVDVFDTRRPSPASIESVDLKLTPPGQADEIQVNVPVSEKDGVYQIATDAMNIPGDWKVSVVVHRTGVEDSVLKIPWTVALPAPVSSGHRTLISSRPLAPAFTITSLLLSVLLGGFWLLIFLQADGFRWSRNKSVLLQDEDQIYRRS